MKDGKISRRRFVQGSGAVAGTSMLRLSAAAALATAQAACSARDEEAAFTTLTADEARELEAIAARILPTTDTPGARDAGVIYFFDAALGDQMAGMLRPVRGMLPQFGAGIAERFPGAERFSDLDEADQDAWLTEQEETPLFGMVRALTLIGFFAMEKYGGNKDHLSWELIGFDGHGIATPPFGYYDAEYMAEHPEENIHGA